ncbi:MAG: substrate-binding domain-containing protein [Bacteroidales bacterium]|nr:substrate-binding domain-containing protein [Bacteroidales bacterium]
MNKKIVFASLCMFLIAACTREPLKIGFSVGDFSSDRWSQEPQIFQDEATALGAQVLFEYAYGDANQQIEQVRKLIASDIQVLIIFPTSADNWAPIVEEAHKAGITVIAYDRMLKDAGVDYYFSFFNEDVGKQQAQYAVDNRPKGNYIILGGPTSDNNSLLLMQGQKNVLQPYIDRGDITILLEKHLETWNSIDAYNEMQTFLDKNKVKIDAILAANDELAGGSIMALEMVEDSMVMIITGQDASVGGCQNILNGKQSMTVYKSIRNLAREAAQASVKMAKSEKITNATNLVSDGTNEIPAVLLKTVVVDKNNMKETVIADGFIKEDQLSFAP